MDDRRCRDPKCNRVGSHPEHFQQHVIDVNQQTFNRHAVATLEDCLAVCTQRAGEYSDSWAIENQNTVVLDHTLRIFGNTPIEVIGVSGDQPRVKIAFSKEQKRLLIMASMIDIKMSRMQGPFKEDTFQDLINYYAAYNGLMKEYLEGVKSAKT